MSTADVKLSKSVAGFRAVEVTARTSTYGDTYPIGSWRFPHPDGKEFAVLAPGLSTSAGPQFLYFRFDGDTIKLRDHPAGVYSVVGYA